MVMEDGRWEMEDVEMVKMPLVGLGKMEMKFSEFVSSVDNVEQGVLIVSEGITVIVEQGVCIP